jgi:hypothetical protein
MFLCLSVSLCEKEILSRYIQSVKMYKDEISKREHFNEVALEPIQCLLQKGLF